MLDAWDGLGLFGKSDREAYREVEASLLELQEKIQEQKDAIAFYRGIVSPADGKPGLRVQDFRLTRGAEEREFLESDVARAFLAKPIEPVIERVLRAGRHLRVNRKPDRMSRSGRRSRIELEAGNREEDPDTVCVVHSGNPYRAAPTRRAD